MKKRLLNLIQKIRPVAYTAAGSFIIAAGWSWYHISRRPPHWKFVITACLIWAGVFVGYNIFKLAYSYITVRFNRHPFWQTEFKNSLNTLFFIGSLTFLVFFIEQEWISLLYFVMLIGILFWRIQHYLSLHPNGKDWKSINKQVFIFIAFLFVLLSVLQYSAYHYYILDENSRFYGIVLFRSWAMTMFWVLGFAVASIIFWRFRTKWKYLFLVLWSSFFIFTVVVWVINIGILYFSGIYLNPIMLNFARGASPVIFNWLTPFLIGGGILALASFGFMLRKIVLAHSSHSKRYWYYYNFTLIAVSILSIFGLSSFKNTPEYVMARSFYSYFKGQKINNELSPIVQAKLERFGLYYNLNQFDISKKQQVFTPGKLLLSKEFVNNPPNIVIIFLESFSSRLTDIYNPKYKDLTPGLDKMAADKNTTVFHKYFNASTPTVTGIISQLCSVLPTTGYQEIQIDRKLQRVYTLCLPEILKESGGYKYASYITAVDKDFENKGSILESMGVNDFFGTTELRKIVQGEPLSWGYSDHQMFPATWRVMNEKAKEPFLVMLSTVDTHPPFNLAKDMVKYGDGKNNVLNSFYTTDHAFDKFWTDFKASKFAFNTIVVAVADHAIFPGAFSKDLFPNEAGGLSYYDENMYMMYVPDSILPKKVDMYSSGLDFTPTLLQILNINVPNSFEGHSIFDDRSKYPSLVGMHELGLYINQVGADGNRIVDYTIPSDLICKKSDFTNATSTPLTPCEYLDFYNWKRQMFEQGRLW